MTAADAYKDASGRPVVAVTGLGVITSLGRGKAANWEALKAGRSGIRQITRFETLGMRTTIAGTVDFLVSGRLPAPLISEQLAVLAAEEAIEEAGLSSIAGFPGPLFLATQPIELEWPERIGLAHVAGTTYGSIIASRDLHDQDMYETFLLGGLAERIADTLGTQGTPVSIATACASGATTIQLGVEAIRRGETDAALCLGVDSSVNPEGVIRFSLLSALSTSNNPPESAIKPFSKNRDGFVMGEGAGALVLENLETARARDAQVYGILSGVGEKADSFHRTRSSPDGSAIIAAIAGALEDAMLEPDQIDYINAHGTGTPENDKMEFLAIRSVFGERAETLPVSSNKSMIGHTLTAAGAVEAVFSLLTLQEQLLPPTINYHLPDPTLPLDVVPNAARPANVNRVMSNSFGFGGQNVCLVFEREPA